MQQDAENGVGRQWSRWRGARRNLHPRLAERRRGHHRPRRRPANLMYLSLLAAGIGGALLARFRAAGMTRALLATALAQALVAAMAIAAGWDLPRSGPLEILGLTAFFVALWLTSVWLFLKATRGAPR